MSKTIKIRRAGIRRIFRGSPFRKWLSEQPRKKLTYRKDIRRREELGWSTEDFTLEANFRGLDVRFTTATKWAAGSEPRWMSMRQLQGSFPGIVF